jgi:hypothetical protein
MGEIEDVRETHRPRDGSTSSPSNGKNDIPAEPGMHVAESERKTFWQRVREPGSVWQIIFAALLAIAIGLIVTTQVEKVHPAAIALTAIPGTLWLRALRAVGTLVPISSFAQTTNMTSPSHDCNCHDHGHPTSPRHDPRWR